MRMKANPEICSRAEETIDSKKMKPIHGYNILLVVLTSLSGLELLQGRAVQQRDTSASENDMKSVNCATRMREEKCSSFSPAQNYSLMLSSPVYSPRQEIKVKVFMTHCPPMDLHGPRWYQLEIVANTDKPQTIKSAGEFYIQRSHVHVCNHRSRVVFAACDPKSFDLPGNYRWIAPKTLAGEICFRPCCVFNMLCETLKSWESLDTRLEYRDAKKLTVQQGETNENCEEKIMCIQAIESESSGQEFGDSVPESGSGNYDYHDEEESDSSHSKSEHPTLTDVQDLDIEDDKESTDFQEISAIGTPTCNSDRQFFLSFNYAWIPHCNCHGFYEPVQCWMKGDQLECWCSTRTGSMIGNTRTILSCTDPEQLEFDCTGAS